MLKDIRIVLMQTSHPGNIGASARAMKNMGIENLYLVSPKIFPDEACTARAKHATDILETAVVTNNLSEALAGCTMVFGTSARDFNLNISKLTPKVAANIIFDKFQSNIQHKIAIIFGTERTGLTKHELLHCNHIINIPTSNYASLNLAQAVQLVCYELYDKLSDNKSNYHNTNDVLAASDELSNFYQELEQTLINIKMLDPDMPRTLMQRMQELYNRSALTKVELNMLRGMLTAIKQQKSQS